MSSGSTAGPGPVLRLIGVNHGYRQGQGRLEVLSDINIDLYPGEMVGLLGPSGSGKSTLLHVAGLLETPESGKVEIDGVDCTKISDRARTRIRRDSIGVVYQFHQLLPEFTALENVMLANMIAGVPKSRAKAHALELLDKLKLGARAAHKPAEMSGGEQQRVAIARTLANEPRIVLADEPTGNLDPRTADLVFDEFVAAVRGEAAAALIATHSRSLAARMDRTLVFGEDGLHEIMVPTP